MVSPNAIHFAPPPFIFRVVQSVNVFMCFYFYFYVHPVLYFYSSVFYIFIFYVYSIIHVPIRCGCIFYMDVLDLLLLHP